MIPKVIHYCWFGGGAKPKCVMEYINGWRKSNPAYVIKEWNETNCNLEECDFIKEAYARKKWAFVSDFIRLYVLYNEGGIYLDTDIEVLSSFDKFLNNEAFTGYESLDWSLTCVIGSVKGGSFVGEMLSEYYERSFVNENGSLNTTPNVSYSTRIIKTHGGVFDGTRIHIPGFITVYPKDVFSSPDYETGKILITENTCAIHHMVGTWMPIVDRFARWVGRHTNLQIEYWVKYFLRRPDYVLASIWRATKRRFVGR